MVARSTKTATRRRAPAPPRGPSLFSRIAATLSANRRVLLDIAAVLSLIAGIIGMLAVVVPSGPTGWATGPVHHWLTLALGWTAFLTPV